MIAGSVLPIQRAEELLATLPGVISARIVASANGAVDEIHVLTTDDLSPKQTVRNIESALIAHLGMRVSHKKISVATTTEGSRARQENEVPLGSGMADQEPSVHRLPTAPVADSGEQPRRGTRPPVASYTAPEVSKGPRIATPPDGVPELAAEPGGGANANARRRLYFEDIEVRRSRSKGVACRVTLKKGDQSYVGEAEGLENERLRIELAARATLQAITQAEGDARVLGLEGCKSIDAFDREFVFVGVTTRMGRESALLTGSAEVKESAETASVLAVLDATNRWIEYAR